MELELYRDSTANGCTLGTLSINGVFECYTLELPLTATYAVAILAGTYPVTLGWSAHFERVMPHVNNVPGRSEIEIHPGNYVTQTKGCILVGEKKERDYILNSDAAFEKLFAKIHEAVLQEPVTIRVVNPA